MLLPREVLADELLHLRDFALLLLERPPLHLEPLGLLPPIRREVARIRVHRPLHQLEGPRGHFVEEIPVVADHQHRLLGTDQKIFEPLGGLDVPVVRRLVQ